MPDNKVTIVITGENESSPVFAQVGEQLASVAEGAARVTEALEAMGAFEVGRQLLELSEKAIETAAGFEEMSKRTGIGVSELQALNYAANATGVGTEELGVGIKKLQVALAQASEGAAKPKAALEAVGVSARDASGKVTSAMDALKKISDAFAGAADDATKTQIAVELFGKSGQMLIPLLDQGSEKLNEMFERARMLGAVFGSETSEAAKKFERDLQDLHVLADAATTSFISGMLPALDRVAQAMIGPGAQGFKTIGDLGKKAGRELQDFVLVLEYIVNYSLIAGQGLLELGKIIQNLPLHDVSAVSEAFQKLKDIISGKDPLTQALLLQTQQISAALIQDAKTTEEKKTDVTKTNLRQRSHDADEIRKLELANELQLAQQFAKFWETYDQQQMQRTEEVYRAGLMSARAYYTTKRQYEEDSVESAIEAVKSELEIERNALKTASDKKQQLEAQQKINALVAQQQQLQLKLNEIQGKTPTGKADPLLQQAREMQIYGAEAQKLGQQIADMFAETDERVQKVKTDQENLVITSVDAEHKINAIRDQSAQKIGAMVAEYKELSDASGDPKLIANADKFEKKIDELKVHVDNLRKQAIERLTNDTANFFQSEIDGTSRGADAFKKFIQSLISDLAAYETRLLAVLLVQKALGWFSQLFGGGGSGGPGDLSGGVDDTGGLPIGSVAFNAGGGDVKPGDWSWVGENGPELVRFGSAATVIPNSASMAMAGGGGDTYHIDARGAQAGVSQEILNAIRVSHEAAVKRAQIEVRETRRRRA